MWDLEESKHKSVDSWAKYFNSESLHFFICKMGMTCISHRFSSQARTVFIAPQALSNCCFPFLQVAQSQQINLIEDKGRDTWSSWSTLRALNYSGCPGEMEMNRP